MNLNSAAASFSWNYIANTSRSERNIVCDAMKTGSSGNQGGGFYGGTGGNLPNEPKLNKDGVPDKGCADIL